MAKLDAAQEKNATTKRPIWLRWLRPWHIVAVIALAVAFYFFYNWWVSPEHRIAQFQAAVNSGNLDEMMALASPDEVSHLGLTPEKLSSMMAEASPSPDGIRMIRRFTKPIDPGPYRYYRMVIFALTDRHGHALINWRGGPHTDVEVIAYNSPTGWHIALSAYLGALSFNRLGPGHYIENCQSHGVPAEVFEPAFGDWEKLGQADMQKVLAEYK